MLAELLWPVAPITAVYINGEGGWMSGDLEYEDVGPHHDRAMPIFAATPQRVRVRSLTIAESGLHGRHVKALLSSPHLTGLRHLDLCSNGLDRGSFGPNEIIPRHGASDASELRLHSSYRHPSAPCGAGPLPPQWAKRHPQRWAWRTKAADIGFGAAAVTVTEGNQR
jgi:hypothetical protein